jgi:hypothetical protein
LVSVVLDTMFVGWSEKRLFRDVQLQGLRSRFASWPSILPRSVPFDADGESCARALATWIDL